MIWKYHVRFGEGSFIWMLLHSDRFATLLLVMPALIGGFGNQKRYESNNNNNQVIENKEYNLKLNYDKLGPYLAGLIEGDGTILVQNSSSIKKSKYRPLIVVVFKLEDLELANYLCNLTKCGKVYKKINRNYVLWLIHDLKGVYTLLNIINGYMRTPKYEAFVRGAEFINNYINSTTILHNKLKNIDNIKIKPLDTSDIGSNAWLAGMTDADGNFSINLINGKNRSSRAMPYYCLELRQNYQKNSPYGVPAKRELIIIILIFLIFILCLQLHYILMLIYIVENVI